MYYLWFCIHIFLLKRLFYSTVSIAIKLISSLGISVRLLAVNGWFTIILEQILIDYLQNRNRLTGTENKLTVTKGEGWIYGNKFLKSKCQNIFSFFIIKTNKQQVKKNYLQCYGQDLRKQNICAAHWVYRCFSSTCYQLFPFPPIIAVIIL